MSDPVTDLNTSEKQEGIARKDTHVNPGSAGPLEGLVDPLSLNSVPGPPEDGSYSSVSARCFSSELCSMMPVVCNVSGGGRVLLVNPCQPRPVFFSLKPAPQRDDGQTQGKDVSVLATPTQLPQYHQATRPMLESRDQTANFQPQAPPAQTGGTGEVQSRKPCHCIKSQCLKLTGGTGEVQSRKPCHCIKSQCLKLYCDCFASGLMCSNCRCFNCHNNPENEMQRQWAIKSCLGRNPDAFRAKIAGGKSEEVKGWYHKRCNCKRSSCLKNYCECYEANIKCSSSCKCVGCRNYTSDHQSVTGHCKKTVEDRWPKSLITHAVVEAVFGCLLAQAERAETVAQSPAQAERMVLDEFGHCLTQIVKAMNNRC